MDELAIDAVSAMEVVAATVVIYLVFAGLVRLLGQRSLAATSIYDVACVVAVGSVIGRTSLLSVPTLGSGIVALVVLFTMQRVARSLRRRSKMRVLLDRQPILLVTDGR